MLRTRLFLLSLLAVFVVSAVATASASAIPMYWIKEGVALKEGERVEAKSHGEPFVLEGEPVVATKLKIECEENGKGWVENPVGGGNAIGLNTMTFTKCTVLKPVGKGCKVGTFVLTVKIEPILIGGEIYGELKPDSGGTTLGTVVLEKCEGAFAALNGKNLPLAGKILGLNKNEIGGGSFKFNEKAPGSKLEWGGVVATFEGTSFLTF